MTPNRQAGELQRGSARDSVTIAVGNVWAEVRPATESMLAPLLRFTENHYQPGGPSGCSLVSRDVSFFFPMADGAIGISAGTAPRVAAELRRLGYEVHLTDLRRFDTPQFSLDEALLGSVGTAELRMLEAVAQNPMGRLCIPPGGLRDRYIGLLCRYFHRAKILIPSATLAQADRLAGALAEYVGGNVDVVHKREWRSPARVVCCTLSSFDAAEPYDGDVLLFPFGEQLLSRKAISGWRDFHNTNYFPRPHRVYAFMAPGQRNRWATELQLEVLAGPVIYQAPTIVGHQARVRVVFASSPWLPYTKRVGALEDMRRLVWHNSPRNEVLAALARGCRRGDLEALWPHGVLLDDQQFPVGRAGAVRVAILVESPEQGRELQRLLPDWPLLQAGIGGADGLPSQAAGGSAWGLPDQAIVTLVRASQMRLFNPHVLIMATGRVTPSLPEVFPPMGPNSPHGQILIIDLDDDFDCIARHDTRQRLECYRTRGFEVDAPARWRTSQPRRSR